uniref:Extracellular globin n=2 Tax=Sclerolinum brattstromi TaxID=167799 RepID=A0A0S2MLP6_9ANNE|nr:hemoglobin subunit A2 [Sclerolinum brattstromi]
MKSLIAFMCLLAVAFASECGPLQRLKVKRQWAEAYGADYSREKLGHAIWSHVFQHAPAARDMFARVRGDNIHTPEFRAHAMRVIGGVDMCIALLDDEDILNSQLGHLAEQHSSRGVDAASYDTLEHAIMMAVEEVIGSQVFDEDAWEPCLDVITAGIQG